MTEERTLVANLVPEVDQNEMNQLIESLKQSLTFTSEITATVNTTGDASGGGSTAPTEAMQQASEALTQVSEALSDADLGGTLQETMQTVSEVSDVLDEVDLEGIQETITQTSEAMADLSGSVTEAMEQVGEAVSETSEAVGEAMEGLGDGLGDLTDTVSEGNERSQSIGSSLLSGMGTVAEVGVGALRSILDIAQGFWKRLESASPLLRDTMNLISNALNLILMPVGTAIAVELIPLVVELYQFIAELTQTMWKAYEEGGLSAMIVAGITEGIPALLEFFQEALMLIPDDIPVISDIRDFAVWTLNWLEENADVLVSVMEGVLEAVKTVGDNLGIVVTLIGAFIGVWVSYKIIDSASSALTDVPLFGNLLKSAVDIPLMLGALGAGALAGGAIGAGVAGGLGLFAEGGRVDRPTLSITGESEPEYIIPESKVPAFIQANSRSGGGDSYTINFYGYNDDEFVRRVEDVVNRNTTLSSLRGGF